MNQNGEVRIVDLGAEDDGLLGPDAPVRPSFSKRTRFLLGSVAAVALVASLALLPSSNGAPPPPEVDTFMETPTATATLSRWQVWVPWLETPDAVVHFTLPSGTPCEHGIAARTGDPADIVTAQDFLRTTDLLAAADVDGALDRSTIPDIPVQDANSKDVVPALKLYSEDELYRNAVTSAISTLIWEETETLGTRDASGVSDLSFESQTNCVGMSR